MKREEILAMEPGEKLDRLVAVKLMGYQIDKHRNGWVKLGDFSTYPKRYSTDNSAVWEVEEKVIASHRIRYAYALAGVIANTRINNPDDLDDFITRWSDNLLAMIHATSEQRCKAALLAVLEEGEEA